MTAPTASGASQAATRYQGSNDLWLITTFFNPVQYRSKRELYERFRAPISAGGLNLLTVECAFDDQPFTLAPADDILQIRAHDVLWQKERLLNLAIAALPRACTKVAWLDGDILFTNPAWAVEAAAQLERHVLVQLFDQAVQLPPGEIANGDSGERLQGFASAVANDAALAASGEWDLHGHTGYAWAARRELIERHGLYDRFVLGGADHAIAHAAGGGWDSPCLQRRWQVNPSQQLDFEAWARPFAAEVDGRIGHVSGAVLHLWHGSAGNRRYEQRHQDLARAGFDPRVDLRLDESGCWCWASHKPALRSVVRQYFVERMEDEHLAPPAAATPCLAAPRVEPQLPAVTVIVPVFNGSASIEECLSSLQALDYPIEQLELLCVDNGSTDDTVARVRRFAHRVTLLHEATRGAAAARNRGIGAARHDWIAFTDADCRVDRDWLLRLIPPLKDPAVGIAGGRIQARHPANFVERFGEKIHDHQRAIEVFSPPYAITMNWASRREVLIDAGLFDERLLRGQDSELAFRIGARGLRLVYVDDAVIYHRNERNLWGLFHEGYTHGYHAPRIRALHSDALSLPDKREQLKRALRRAWQSSLAERDDWRQQLCERVFNLGKALGEVYGIARLPGSDIAVDGHSSDSTGARRRVRPRRVGHTADR